jgi:hypothetical protein
MVCLSRKAVALGALLLAPQVMGLAVEHLTSELSSGGEDANLISQRDEVFNERKFNEQNLAEILDGNTATNGDIWMEFVLDMSADARKERQARYEKNLVENDPHFHNLTDLEYIREKYFPEYTRFDCGRAEPAGCKHHPETRKLYKMHNEELARNLDWTITAYDRMLKTFLETDVSSTPNAV